MSSRYWIETLPAAAKALRALPRSARRRIESAIDSLADNPRPSGSKILQGRRRYTRIRVGNYRVVYLVEDERITIVVVRIGPRKDIYRGL